MKQTFGDQGRCPWTPPGPQAPDPVALPVRRTGRVGVALILVAMLTLGPAGPQAGAQVLASGSVPGNAAAPPQPPLFDHSLMLVGCMGGLALGALSVIFPPMAAGMWMGGLGVMVVRAGLGCAYGGLAGVVSSIARATVRWSETEWRGTPQRPAPLPVAGTAGT